MEPKQIQKVPHLAKQHSSQLQQNSHFKPEHCLSPSQTVKTTDVLFSLNIDADKQPFQATTLSCC